MMTSGRTPKRSGFTIVSKDSDFAERSAFDQHAGKVVWIRLGNCSTNELEQLLRSAFEVIRAFVEEDPETCLLLRRT